jgi:exo-beta-1,3-glucanase (GH17 family)
MSTEIVLKNILTFILLIFLIGCGGGNGRSAGGSGGGNGSGGDVDNTAPPAVTTLAATSVSGTGATLNGNVTPNGLPTDAWFEWGTDPVLASYSTTSKQPMGFGTTGLPVSDTLTGLAAGTTYYARVAAGNSSGTTRGTIVDFTPEPPSPKYKLHGIDFSPYMDGQDPNLGSRVSEQQLSERLAIIAPYVDRARSFGSTAGLEHFGRLAHQRNLEAWAGAWIGKDNNANDLEIDNLIAAGKAGQADVLIVGSEVLLRNDQTETGLIEYIRKVKQAVPGVPVTTAEVYGVLLTRPSLIAEIDLVMVNYYPYWEGIKLELAISYVHGRHQQVKAISGGKQVVVSETGWPSGGNQVGEAVPSPENAAFYFLNFVSWARANDVPYFYFEAFDESWKAAYEGPQGAHWGIWDKDGNMKPGMQAVFDNQVMADNWSSDSIPGGPGTPTIEFTAVPPLGSGENLYGQSWHVKPTDYRVVVYIFVPGAGWWIKPYFDAPLTPIVADGSWSCDITTGGNDQTATQIAAYLVPMGYSPPLIGGDAVLPPELDQNAVGKVQVTR